VEKSSGNAVRIHTGALMAMMIMMAGWKHYDDDDDDDDDDGGGGDGGGGRGQVVLPLVDPVCSCWTSTAASLIGSAKI